MQGCYDKLNDFIDKYQYWAIGIVAVAVFIVIEVRNYSRDALIILRCYKTSTSTGLLV